MFEERLLLYSVFEERLARTLGERSHGMFEERSTS